MKDLVYGLSFLILLASCSVEKRHYRSGFYVTHKNSKEIKHVNAPIAKVEKMEPVDASKVHFYTEPVEKIEPVIVASNEKKIYTEEIKSPERFVGPLENCDTIFLVDKTGIKAKVVEITATEVKYKYCDNIDGPLRSISKYTVRYISYANGSKEVVTPEYVPAVTNTSDEPRKPRVKKQLNLLALSGFILGILPYPVTIVMLYANLISGTAFTSGGAIFSVSAFYFPAGLAILAVLLSVIAIVQISKERDKYKGMPFAIMGAAFGAAIALILLLVLSAL